MTALRRKLIAAIFGFCGMACCPPPVAWGQASQGYADYRQSLIGSGWRPNVGYGLKTAGGKALYKFPEVVCGPTLCNAKWRDPQGREKLITLIRGLNGADHRVAPQ